MRRVNRICVNLNLPSRVFKGGNFNSHPETDNNLETTSLLILSLLCLYFILKSGKTGSPLCPSSDSFPSYFEFVGLLTQDLRGRRPTSNPSFCSWSIYFCSRIRLPWRRGEGNYNSVSFFDTTSLDPMSVELCYRIVSVRLPPDSKRLGANQKYTGSSTFIDSQFDPTNRVL